MLSEIAAELDFSNLSLQNLLLLRLSHPSHSGNECHEDVEHLQVLQMGRITWQIFLLC